MSSGQSCQCAKTAAGRVARAYDSGDTKSCGFRRLSGPCARQKERRRVTRAQVAGTIDFRSSIRSSQVPSAMGSSDTWIRLVFTANANAAGRRLDTIDRAVSRLDCERATALASLRAVSRYEIAGNGCQADGRGGIGQRWRSPGHASTCRRAAPAEHTALWARVCG